jgi:hypothetical protein
MQPYKNMNQASNINIINQSIDASYSDVEHLSEKMSLSGKIFPAKRYDEILGFDRTSPHTPSKQRNINMLKWNLAKSRQSVANATNVLTQEQMHHLSLSNKIAAIFRALRLIPERNEEYRLLVHQLAILSRELKHCEQSIDEYEGKCEKLQNEIRYVEVLLEQALEAKESAE